jgi:type II secretory pathway pseudopilin PulG
MKIRERMKHLAGWSLIELTIILVVLSILSAILAPVISRYVRNAKVVRAREDVQALGSAIMMFIEDTANSYFMQDGSPCTAQGASRTDGVNTEGGAPNQAAWNRVDMLVGDGDVPELGPNGSYEWTQAVNFSTVDFFEYHLCTNNPGNNSAHAYRTPTDLDKGAGAYDDDPMFARRSSGGFNSEFAWRGPYITAPIDPDPWGNRYASNVKFLDPLSDSSNNEVAKEGKGGFEADVVILTAGPDEEIDTKWHKDGLTAGDDDILYTVSANSRP